MENETLIDGNMLLTIGFLTILIGLLLIMIGIALSIFQKPKSTQTDSNRTNEVGRNINSKSTPDSEIPLQEKPSEREVKSEIKAGGVIMLGPIPIIFGSDKDSTKTAIILAIILMLLSLLLFKVSLF